MEPRLPRPLPPTLDHPKEERSEGSTRRLAHPPSLLRPRNQDRNRNANRNGTGSSWNRPRETRWGSPRHPRSGTPTSPKVGSGFGPSRLARRRTPGRMRETRCSTVCCASRTMRAGTRTILNAATNSRTTRPIPGSMSELSRTRRKLRAGCERNDARSPRRHLHRRCVIVEKKRVGTPRSLWLRKTVHRTQFRKEPSIRTGRTHPHGATRNLRQPCLRATLIHRPRTASWRDRHPFRRQLHPCTHSGNLKENRSTRGAPSELNHTRP